MVATAAPPRPFHACVIKSPDHGVRLYTKADLPQALADIEKAKTKRPTLLVGVVGSRDLEKLLPLDPAQARLPEADELRARLALDTTLAAVQKLCNLHNLPLSAVVVVSGGARGIDRVAERFAHWQRLPLIVFPADWEGPDGKRAGFTRNTTIAEVVDELLAWPRRNSRDEPDGGTMDTVTKARERMKPVTILF